MSLENLKKIMHEAFEVGMAVETDSGPKVQSLATMIADAGPQKMAEKITKMDPTTFALFCQRIDKEGLNMLGDVGATSVPAGSADVTQPSQPTQATPQVAPPVEDDLKDL